MLTSENNNNSIQNPLNIEEAKTSAIEFEENALEKYFQIFLHYLLQILCTLAVTTARKFQYYEN